MRISVTGGIPSRIIAVKSVGFTNSASIRLRNGRRAIGSRITGTRGQSGRFGPACHSNWWRDSWAT